ncbi:DeoR/GlpR family DNA-binding transcription regulator [Streptomyces nojiriensis]|uniref:DeoR/GlpR family DNA-binding transcription regulator n=1 Tax=Streptomyces nojiriensis TaxID=66374 RepID=UPI0036DE23EF
MYAPERRHEILGLARAAGSVDVLSLADRFQVTAETVRRDLTALDRSGLLRRVHGGAIPAGRLDFEPDLTEREATAAGEKHRIATAALAELPDDAWALRAYAENRADVLFLATSGFTAKGGLTTPDLGEAAVKRVAMAAARRVVLLADIDLLITDAGLAPADKASIEAAGTEVVLV